MGGKYYTTSHSNTIVCPNCSRQFGSSNRGRAQKLMTLHIKKCCPEKTHIEWSHHQVISPDKNDVFISNRNKERHAHTWDSTEYSKEKI